MDDRYEIRGKIGQGGFGAVYRAYDKHLSREVAIKRILPEASDERESEAARQLTKEAGALSALQHPHIVTIYDVGIDKDGPFVVMELLHGFSIDAVVEKNVFTWPDFREFALQTQEALIAAQDLNLVHRDIKPSNVMLTWLPSGKFQVKVVDFGLAKFTPKPSLQTIDLKDSIFGSIFFMAPEQFERVELDARTDMYSIGCVYYYALTGSHPFDGDTGPQVMVSHLDHRVFPLHEIRPDIPRWASDWIMWHINRLPEHRPTRAREALALFIQNDQATDYSAAVEEIPRAKSLVMTPGARGVTRQAPPKPPVTAALLKSAPQPITPPENFGRPSIHTSSQVAIQSDNTIAPSPNAPQPAEVATPPAAPATPIAAVPAPAPAPVAVPAPAPIAVAEPAAIPVPLATPTPSVPAADAPVPAANEGSVQKPKPRLLIPGAKPAEAAAAKPAEAVTPVGPALSEVTPTVVPTAVIPTITPAAVTPTVTTPAPPPPPIATAKAVAVATPVSPLVTPTISPTKAAIPAPVAIAKPTLQAGPSATIARPVPTAQIAPGAPQTAPLKAQVSAAPTFRNSPPTATKAAPDPASPAPAAGPMPHKKKGGMSSSAKVTTATTLGLVIIILAWVFINRHSQGKVNERYNELVALAAMPNTKELPVTGKDVEILLDAATSISAVTGRETILKALFIAESTDGTNVNDKILAYVTTVNMVEDTRVNLLRRVIGGRIAKGNKDSATAKTLINFINSNPKPESAAAAIDALKGMAADEHLPPLLDVLQFTANQEVRKSCESIVIAILKQSSQRAQLDASIHSAYQSATTPEGKQAMLRVLGATGTDKAREAILSNLKGNDKALQIAAADSAKNWPDESLIEPLLTTVSDISDPILSNRIFQSCRDFLQQESTRSDDKNATLWKLLASSAKTAAEEETVIRSLVSNSSTNKTPWAVTIIKEFEENSKHDRVIDVAGKALDKLETLTSEPSSEKKKEEE